MKKNDLFLLLFSVIALLFSVPVLADSATDGYPTFESDVAKINYSGTLILEMDGNQLLAAGYEFGDIMQVKLPDRVLNLPLVENYSEVAVSAPMCRLKKGENGTPGVVYLGINMGSMAESLGLDIREAENVTDSSGNPVHVTLSMYEKAAYLKKYQLLHVSQTNVREDYPELTDAEYANFRPVSAPLIQEGLLYRSSSPIDPEYNRNREADRCLAEAGIRAIVNLADSEETMKAYKGFSDTAYSACKVIPLDLVMDCTEETFMKGIAEGIRFILREEGPYLIHCKAGKDRTGFLCALLEFLCGASYEEVKADYMLSYVNFYHVEQGTEKYEVIFDSMFVPILEDAFGQHSLSEEHASLSSSAEDYLERTGLSSNEIQKLKQLLGAEQKKAATSTPLSGWDDVFRILAGWYAGHFSQEAIQDAA